MTHRCRRPTGHVNVMGDVWIERCTSDDPHDECREVRPSDWCGCKTAQCEHNDERMRPA